MNNPICTSTLSDVRTRLVRALAAARPQSAEALWQFVRAAYGLAVPRKRVCPGHVAPMEYLERAILTPGQDLVVWASRGGSKTELGSIAAHLDSILRPGCQTRILGGSLDQSEKMYECLAAKWDGPFAAMLAREPSARRTELANGSAIEVLTQSARSVRGHRVHRLKCDEVDEFSREVWQAAQFITQSSPGTDGRWIPAQMEVFSTMHRACGPMAQLVDRVTNCGLNDNVGRGNAPASRRGVAPAYISSSNPQFAIRNPQLLKWCLWETIEPCPPERSCSRCPLSGDCEGRARGADGYFPIDDAIAQKSRASRAAWEAEMLCLRPSAEGLVFSEFDPRRHVAPVSYNPSLPLYRAIDFGYANPFVCLWVQVDENMPYLAPGENTAPYLAPGEYTGGEAAKDAPAPCAGERTSPYLAPGEYTGGEAAKGAPAPCGPPCIHGGLNRDPDLSHVQLRVIAEYVERERPISQHARAMAARDPGPVLATYADPAGWQRTDVTGTGPCQELAAMGIKTRTPHAGILEGVELLRRLLKDRGGGPERAGLVIDPSCRWLTRAMQEYHWEETSDGRLSERPAKDGADHPIDALRYLATGLYLKRGRVHERKW